MTVDQLLPSQCSTADLLARFNAGDERALVLLVARFSGAMRSAARRYLRNEADAADAVQDAWTSFAHHAATIREPERLVGWLRVTASRAALNIALRQARVEPVADIDQVRRPWLATEPADGDLAEARREALREAMHRLRPGERRLLSLLLAEPKLSYEDIAAVLGRPIGSIGPTRQRICTKLARDPAIARVAPGGAA